ncbi:MAG: hydantoinase B/oxoprolinase family protein [Actinobacteria bacterium]|nr:hydantoinase B/oxoprolinase family protein [Actinomycetota bacterium]
MEASSRSQSRVMDLVAVEVFARKLFSITEEMGRTMIRTSGDPVIAEVNDFSTVLTDATGELLAYGYLTIHLGPARRSIAHVIETVPPESIHEGDAWICNDPYTTGNCHPPDVGIVRPIFHQGEMVAWCWAEAHMTDVGGMAPGGFASSAHEVYGEALRFPGVKIVDRGEVIDDVWRLITTNFRLPERNLNQIRCFIAACNTAESRLHDVLDEIGLDGFKERCEAAKDLSEAAMRKRIASLPDGVFEARDYVEHNGHVNDLYEVRCKLIVEGDQLTIDFEGTSAQTDGFINCVAPAVISASLTPLVHILVPDIPVNEGIFRAVEWELPEGSIVNPTVPAPVSAGHLETGLHAGRAVWVAAARLQAAASDAFVSSHTMAPGHDSWIGSMLYAPDENGTWIPFLDMHGGGAGQGAQPHDDGLDAGGVLANSTNQLPDIEITEEHFNVLYLWRKLGVGTGGPGRSRGGHGIEVAWMPWHTPGGSTNTFAATQQVPPHGLFGGYPGSGSRHRLFSDTDVVAAIEDGRMPGSPDDIEGTETDFEAKLFGSPIGPGDVLQVRWGGGGGLGDPLDRDPETVASDVRSEYFAAAAAEPTYGVVLTDEGEVDSAATAAKRARIKEERRAWPILGEGAGVPAALSAAARATHPALREDADGALVCTGCDHPIVAPGAQLHASLPARRRRAAEAMAEVGGWCLERDDVDLVEFACPDCGSQLDVRVVVS